MIIKNNETAIKLKCEDVSPNEIGELVALLERELFLSEKLGNPGVGLAAPQIGIAKKIAIVRIPVNYSSSIDFNLINCEIAEKYDQFIFKDEGCLSFPGRVENTLRYNEIVIKNNLSYLNSFIVSGLPAIVCQHELDHLNEILIFDSMVKKPQIKLYPNDPCPCGKIDLNTKKIKKYKKCCSKLEVK